MFDNVIDKIKYEYEHFRSAMLRTSSSNIYASAKEIDIKKRIYLFILNINFGKSKTDEKTLLCIPNLLEYYYLEIVDRNIGDNILEKYLEKCLYQESF